MHYAMNAYDLSFAPVAAPQSSNTQGWCFGRPPGIAPEQWPLDPHSGYPLCHGFTLLLPEEYRVHGEGSVALSFFSVAAEHNDGGPISTPGVKELILSPTEKLPSRSEYLEFWTHARNEHPKLFRMQDQLGCAYAVLLLTDDEYHGPICDVPEIVDNPFLRNTPRPGWVEPKNEKSIWWDMYLGVIEDTGFGLKDVAVVRFPEPIAFSASKREDPNAGKSVTDPDYESRLDANYEWKEWACSLASNHIGGTMDAVQAPPKFSPFFIGFDEFFGGFNFGGGTAQLDFKLMKFSWDCG